MIVTCNSTEEIGHGDNSLQEGNFLFIFNFKGNMLWIYWRKTYLLGCKPVDEPIEQNHSLEETYDQVYANKEIYQRQVGRLICRILHMILHTQSMLRISICTIQVKVIWMRILCYLKSTPRKKNLWFFNIDI